jgi:phosphoserine phosphatase RsbU/P
MLVIPGVVEISQQSLQLELCYLVAATVFLAVGVASTILGLQRSRDRLLLSLGIFVILYGLRLMAEHRLVPVALGVSPARAGQIIWAITCCILLPGALFFRELLGDAWRKTTTAWLWLQVVFAPLGIILGMWKYRDLMWTVNNLLAIVASLFVLVAVFAPARPVAVAGTGLDSKSQHVLRGALIVFAAFVIVTNFQILPGGHDIEPIGFAALIAGLGYSAAKRSLERERKLLDVEHELETARRIQRSILPRQLPNVPGLQLAARYEPMTAVAGDFYDFLPAADGRGVTILVADVSGHGVPAALIASMIKVSFEAQTEHVRDPARILAGLNATLAGQLDGQFVTAACAFLDLAASSITYAGAGHPPALLVRGNGEISELAENGLMLGPFRHSAYANITAPFVAGDKLVLYTDGILEATVAGEEFGLDRLKDFSRNTPGKFSGFADRLIAAVAGPVQEDDLTVVVAQSGPG